MTRESWQHRQRTGFAAWAVCDLPVGGDDPRDDQCFDASYDLLRNYLTMGEQEYGSLKSYFMALPPAVLSLLVHVRTRLSSFLDDQLYADLLQVESVLAILCPPPSTSREPWIHSSPINKARIWAYHALFGMTGAERMLRLGSRLFGKSWHRVERDDTVAHRLSESLQSIRGCKSTDTRCKAIEDLSSCFASTRFWSQIENIMYNGQFCWPLLVINDICYSLPIAIDIDHQGTGKAYPLHIDNAVFGARWDGILQKAFDIAKQIWSGTYLNFRSHSFIDNFDVDVSLDDAHHIVRELGASWRGILGKPFLLTGRSAEAYFAMAILSRLLGQPYGSTGVVGAPVGRRNWQFIPPANIENKLRYVFSSRWFERVVLPKADMSGTALCKVLQGGSTQTAETIQVRDLHTLADAMHVRRWRQHQYIRCPDLLWGIHSRRLGRPGLVGAGDHEVQRIMTALATNQDTIFQLTASPITVASALWHINGKLRRVMSWAIVRLLDNETDGRFWRIVWQIIGAGDADFYSFLQHTGRDAILVQLQNYLNQFVPDGTMPSRRVPELIVIIGGTRLIEKNESILNPEHRIFYTKPILDALVSRLKPNPDVAARRYIGRTRIILLPNDMECDVGGPQSTKSILKADRDLLMELAVFKWGFTQEVARGMLSASIPYRGTEFGEHVLESLVRKDLLREGQGMYHVPHEIAVSCIDDRNPKIAAGRFFRAAAALVPYAAEVDFPSLGIDIAFGPEYMHEADYHLREALRYAQRAGEGAQGIERACRKILEHLYLFSLPADWGLVANLHQSRELAHSELAREVALERLRLEDIAEAPSHPQHLLLAARSSARVVQALRGQSTSPKREEELLIESNSLFERAITNCAIFPSEEAANLVLVLTGYAVFKKTFGQSGLRELIDKVLELLDVNKDLDRIARGDFFEMVGDIEIDNSKAAILYRRGLTSRLQVWNQLWVKAVGAESLAEGAVVSDILRELSAEKVASILAKVKRRRRSYIAQDTRLHDETGVQDITMLRWQEGLKVFDRLWGQDPFVKNALDRLGHSYA